MTETTQPTKPSITLKLKSKEGDIFEVEKPVAMHINFVKNMLEDVVEEDGMEIPIDIKTSVLEKVVEFCKFRHEQEPKISKARVDLWETNFVQVDKSTLFEIMIAANFLDVQSLIDLIGKTVANMLKGKTRAQICREFDLPYPGDEQLEEHWLDVPYPESEQLQARWFDV